MTGHGQFCPERPGGQAGNLIPCLVDPGQRKRFDDLRLGPAPGFTSFARAAMSFRLRPLPFLAAGAAALATGCGKPNEFAPPPPPEVNVQRPVDQPVTVFIEFPGRTQAVARVEVRARVRGFLQTREFQPGQFVNGPSESGGAGDLLFTIEDDEYRATLAKQEAALAQAKANLELAETTLASLEKALETNAVSKIQVDEARAQRDVAQSAIQSAEAAVDQAQLDLDYTRIHAPTSGRVSREFVDVGNLVGSGEPTLLTTIVRDDPVFVNFEVNERAILRYLEDRPSQDAPTTAANGAKRALRLMLADGSEYPLPGSFDFIDNAANPETGTFKVRAVFENPEGSLADGLFVRIGIPETLPNEAIPDAVLVPRAALQRDLQGTFALVVGEGDVVERRIVVPSSFTVGPYRIVAEGLTADDRVIVSNLQRAREGIEVIPTEVEPEPVPEAGSGSAGAPAGEE